MYYDLLFLLVLFHQLYIIFNIGIDQCQSSHPDILRKPVWGGEMGGATGGGIGQHLEIGITSSVWHFIPNH